MFAAMKSIRTLAFLTAAFAYALIVLGAVVRVTGSGLGCGDDWPLCNGRIIPEFHDIETAIEYTHRLAAATIGIPITALAALVWLKRREPGVSGPGGPLRPALAAFVLLGIIASLGAVTVKLDLHAGAVVPHLAAALKLLAALLITGYRAGAGGGGRGQAGTPDRTFRGAVAALVLSAAVILLGGLTATTGASAACQGFPLCNGQLWPSGGGPAHLHWIHRLLAYALFLHLAAFVFKRARLSAAPIRSAAWLALGVATLQVVVAAVMVLGNLPTAWRAAHAAVGVALWVSLVRFTWLTRHTR